MNAPPPKPAAAGENLLRAMRVPLFFEIPPGTDLGLPLPPNRQGQSVRVWARSLTVMQKEAVVHAAGSGRTWRLASDEGPYLRGHDYGPCPLSFFSTGMVASFFTELAALAAQRGIALEGLRLVQHNHYAMEGSALDGTMTGSALPVELEVHADCPAGDEALAGLAAEAVRASPAHGLLAAALPSLFTLCRNGAEIDPGGVSRLGAPALPDPRPLFDALAPLAGPDPGWITKVEDVSAREGPGDAGSSLNAVQKRTLHLKVTCRQREDGVKVIRQEMFNPAGSTFEFLSDEAEAFGGRSRAPEAAAYMAAGIAFCFMTQLGRYARIVKRRLDAYDVVQDTHFSAGGASAGSGRPGTADPVETHLHLATSEDDAFARTCLGMGVQTCYLHAVCRSELPVRISTHGS